jgi:hypothetical protein
MRMEYPLAATAGIYSSYRKCRPTGPASSSSLFAKGVLMGFSGIRAIILVVVLLALVLGVTKLNLPGWFVPVGIILTAGILKGAEKKASA